MRVGTRIISLFSDEGVLLGSRRRKERRVKLLQTPADYASFVGGWKAALIKRLNKETRKRVGRLELVHGLPTWTSRTGPFAFLKATGDTLRIGFFRGDQLRDGASLIGDTHIRYMVATEGSDLPIQVIVDRLLEAEALNEEHGDPRRRAADLNFRPPSKSGVSRKRTRRSSRKPKASEVA